MRKSDHGFLLRTLGLGMSGTVAVRAVVELANQLHGPVEGMETSLAMVTDMHPAAARGTIAFEDIKLPGSEFQVLGPGESHGAVLRAVRNREPREKTSLSLWSKIHGF
jgi:hypothetical protein